jgi:hypothetical protein
MLQTHDESIGGVNLENPPAASPPAQANGQPQAASQRIEISDAGVQVGYTNFCWVTTSPDEVLLDFGLSAQRLGHANRSVQVTHRLALTHAAAKRLLAALHMALERQQQVATPSGPAPRA